MSYQEEVEINLRKRFRNEEKCRKWPMGIQCTTFMLQCSVFVETSSTERNHCSVSWNITTNGMS